MGRLAVGLLERADPVQLGALFLLRAAGQLDLDGFDAAYIGVHHARSLAALGDYERAAEIFRSALNGLNEDYHRDRGVYLAREAPAYAGAGEADHAAGIALQTLAVGA